MISRRLIRHRRNLRFAINHHNLKPTHPLWASFQAVEQMILEKLPEKEKERER